MSKKEDARAGMVAAYSLVTMVLAGLVFGAKPEVLAGGAVVGAALGIALEK